MEKKYQVFISSTYEDLIEERKEIIQALLEINCIPTGMEMFQASDDTQWELIKKVIASCDYYLVIVAGRYGSVHPTTQKSFTQMEYEYALEIQIPIIGFLYKNPDNLPAYKLEKIKKNQKKLEQFKQLIKKKMVKFWSNKSELSSIVTRSMYNIIQTHPRKGWSRNDEDKDIKGNLTKNLGEDILFSLLDYQSKELKEMDKQIKSMKPYINYCNFKELMEDYITEDIYKIRTPLIINNFHVDALQEIASIILSSGIKSMSDFFKRIITVQNIRLEVCQNIAEVQNIIEHYATFNLISEFHGTLSGKIYLHFYENPMNIFLNELKQDSHIFENVDKHMILNSLLQELCSIYTGSVLMALEGLFDKYVFQIMNITLNPNLDNINFFLKNQYVFVLQLLNINNNNHSRIVDSYILFDESSIWTILQYYKLL